MEVRVVDVPRHSTTGSEPQLVSPPAVPKPQRMCQVLGCTADLEAIGKPYCSLKRICPVHMKADAIPCSSGLMRYCQQCGVLEPLSRFDEIKRSCRDSLCRRIKRPATTEARTKRKRSAINVSHTSNTINCTCCQMPADAAAAANTATTQEAAAHAGWDAAFLAGATGLPGTAAELAAMGACNAAAWQGSWLLTPSAAGPAAEAALTLATAAATAAVGADSSPAAAASPASSSCTAATPGAPAPGCARSGGAWGPAAAAQAAATAGMSWQALLQQEELQLVCTPQGLAAGPVGISSPISGSYSSSASKDPAVAELEAFMVQELAAAGMTMMDSSSAAALPALPAAAAPVHQQPSWPHQQPCLPHQQQAQQLQQLNCMPPQALDCWHSLAASDALGAAVSCVPGVAASGAAGAWVPAAAAGSLAQIGATSHMQQGLAPAAAPGRLARHGKARAQMMARLQTRLQSLAAQMCDMQLMLRLLEDA